MNIYILPSSAVEISNDNNETYTAMITVRRYFEAMEIQRMNGRSVFGCRICVEFGDSNAHPWKNARFKKYNIFVNFPNEVLLKIFSNLDFQSRIRVESICKSWREIITKNLHVLPPADDTPKNIKLMIAKNICNDQKETAVKYDKTAQRMSVHLVTNGKNSFCVEIYNGLKKILPKIVKDDDEPETEEMEGDNINQPSPIAEDAVENAEQENNDEISNQPSPIVEDSSEIGEHDLIQPPPIVEHTMENVERDFVQRSSIPNESGENIEPDEFIQRSPTIVEDTSGNVEPDFMQRSLIAEDSGENVEPDLLQPTAPLVEDSDNFAEPDLLQQSPIFQDSGEIVEPDLTQSTPIVDDSKESVEQQQAQSSIDIFMDEQNKNQTSTDDDRLSEEALDALECLNEQISEEFHLVPDVSNDHSSSEHSEKQGANVVKARLWLGLARKNEEANNGTNKMYDDNACNETTFKENFAVKDVNGTKTLPDVEEIVDFNLPVCKENQTTSVADAVINDFVDEIKPTLDVGDITNAHFQRTTETSSIDDPPSHPLNEFNSASCATVERERSSADDEPPAHPMDDENEDVAILLPTNSASSSPKMSHQVDYYDDENALIMDCGDEKESNSNAFNEIIDYNHLLIDDGNTAENDMSATNALKNLHELITAATGVDEQPPISVTTTAASFFLPLVTSTTCSNVTVVAAPSSSLLTVPAPKTSSMENIGSKLLLLAAAQSASKTPSSASSSVSISSEHLMPSLSVHPKPNDASLSTSKIKTTRLLLPKPVTNFIDPSTLIATEMSSSLKTSTASSTPQRDSAAGSSQNAPVSVPIVPNTKPTLTLNPKNTVASTVVQSQSHRLLAKILNRTSVSSYTFEPPPSCANFQIPSGGYKCVECGDQYAMKTCLEFHLQRRSLMIETTCIPCKQMFMFFNKCAYFSHIRMHRAKKWMTNVFRSVSIKPIVWKLMEQWFEDTAFKRFSDPDAFYEYEFGENGVKKQNENTIEWHNDIVSAASNGVAKMSSLGGGMFTIVASQNSLVHRCTECAVDLPDAIALKRHFMYNLPANQKQFICTACQAVYFSQCSFSAHKRTHSCASPFVCPECGETLQSSTMLSTHLLSHRCRPTVLDSWRCVKCFTFYSSWEALVIHMAAAHCEMHHCCRSCTMAFSSAVAFEDHKRTAHKYNAPETIEYRLLAKCCSCESLGFQGKDALIEHLKQHFASVSPFKVYRCAMCGRLMENKSGLVSHFKNVHRITVAPTSIEEDRIIIPTTTTDAAPAATPANAVVAPAVQQSNVSQAVANVQAAATVPPSTAFKYFSCKLCRNLHFRSELGLKLHIKMKHSDKPTTPLEIKPASFIQSSSHQSSVPVSQQQQQHSSATSSNHQSTASTVAPAPIPLLSCYLCKKSFDKLESRIDDGLQHLKNGQAVCLLCQNLPMNSLSMLMRHFAKHVDEQERSGKLRDGVVFMCNRHCREEFYDRAKALNHLRSIHGQSILFCDKCRVDFLNDSDIRQHFARFHPDDVKYVDEMEQQNSIVGVKRAATEVSKVAATLAKKACVVQRSTSFGNSNVAVAVAVSPTTTTTTTKTYGSYRCSKCEFKFDTREKMHRHATEKHKEPKFYTCLECASNFASTPSLGRHLITAHQINDVEKYVKEFTASLPRKTNELECDVCHNVFPSKPSLDSHVRTHGLLFLKTQEKRSV